MDTYINKNRLKKQYDFLNTVAKIFNDNDIFYVLVGGNCLALYRDKCLMPYDDDIDILVLEKDKHKIHYHLKQHNINPKPYNWGNVDYIHYKNNYGWGKETLIFIDLFYAKCDVNNNVLVTTHDIIKCNSDCVVKKDYYGLKNINMMCDNHIYNYVSNKYKNWKNHVVYNHKNKKKIINNDINYLELVKEILDNTIVITFGTFDLLHIGHINILNRCKEYGDKLVVGVSSDDLNYKKKQVKPIYDENNRLKIISNIKSVDEVFIEHSLEDKLKYCINAGANIFIIGDDWAGKFDFLKNEYIDVVYLPRTKNISTTEIKLMIKQ